MKNKIKIGLELVLNNFKVLIPLQIFNQLIGVFIIYPITNKIINYAYQYEGRLTLLSLKGLEVSFENLLIFAFVAIVLGLYYFYVVSSFIVLADSLIIDKKVKFRDSLKNFFQVIMSNLNRELLKISIMIALIMPFSALAVFNSAIIPLNVPEFILDFLKYSRGYEVLIVITFILVNIYALFLMYILYDVLINKQTVKEAHRSNLVFIKTNKVNILITASAIVTTLFLVFMSYVVNTFALGVILKQLLSDKQSFIIFSNVHSVLSFLFSLFSGIILLSMTTLSVVYLKRQKKIIKDSSNSLSKLILKFGRNLLLLSLLFSLLFSVKDQVNVQLNEVQIIGHRMGNLEYPENSMLGLKSAIEHGYDMVEIDVQQLKDNTILLVHDKSFKRLAGSSLKVVDSTLDDVLKLDPTYTHPNLNISKEHFATLTEISNEAKGKINLMIEVKTNKTDDNFLEDLITLLKDDNMFNQIELASMDKKLLKNLKEINHSISTTYIATAVIGDSLADDYIDNYSLQLDLLTKNIINKIQSQDKGLYVWTPNNSKSITKALQLNIDGIVTDKPELVKFHIKNPNYSILDEFWNNLFFSNI